MLNFDIFNKIKYLNFTFCLNQILNLYILLKSNILILIFLSKRVDVKG